MLTNLASLPARGERLRDLAELEGITMTALASTLGVSKGNLSKIIAGTTPLPSYVVETAILRYNLPPTFFNVLPAPHDHTAVTFRKKASSSARADRRITRLFREASRLWHTAATLSGLSANAANNLASARKADNIEEAVVRLRDAQGLGAEDPVGNVVRFVEKLGVGVLTGLDPTLAEDPGDESEISAGGVREYSGVTCPSTQDDWPLITTVGPQPGTVGRMTIAHELGHLICDQNLSSSPRSTDPAEKRAFQFAGALLLPETMMRHRVNELMTLNSYLRVKADYGVSVGAIVIRARNLGIISADRARSLHIQIASRGWRDSEPVPVPVEKTLLINQAVQRTWPTKTCDEAATTAGVPRTLIKAWISPDDPKTPSSTANVILLDHARKRPRERARSNR